ncbi:MULTISPECIES: hypothetical protein [unclassified Streptomyces]|uniref:hypothetical protein n=1 Tax=unclassified Streptomyces TaxID=2593676 RepID=UPI000DBA2C10|nr:MULTISPECIES: hypothetical protein [unclassified Streptomyces]MYT70675.1 hypothetical protein [Streptomyces sp. SID8367]RAJ90380.1 hypothetical protein K377_01005 [Streptomyces sp. PsTaAH-137]
MAHRRSGVRATGAAVAAVALALTVAGCSDSDTSPSEAASKVGSAASKAADTVASATAEAGKKIDEFKGGVNAKDDVELGDVATDDGRATVPVTVDNGQSSSKSYAVQVEFRDKGGNLLDTVVVTVNDVGAGASKKATARSNRSLDGDVTADVARALRH